MIVIFLVRYFTNLKLNNTTIIHYIFWIQILLSLIICNCSLILKIIIKFNSDL